MHLLSDMEGAARAREQAVDAAQSALEKSREGILAANFNAFVVDEVGEDPKEVAFREGCAVDWDDDMVISTTGDAAANEAQDGELSYRFTPRSQRPDRDRWDRGRGVARHSTGRAKILLRAALTRHNLQQKALWADVMKASVEAEESGTGCAHLSLQHNRLGSRAAAHLCAYIRASRTLQTLALGCNPIGDGGATLLGRALPKSRCLRTLALQDCAITSRGVRHLAAGLSHNRSLHALWLFGNSACDEGVAHLAAAMRTCRLESLGLEMNGIKQQGAEALAVGALPARATSHSRISRISREYLPRASPVGVHISRATRRAYVWAPCCRRKVPFVQPVRAIHSVSLLWPSRATRLRPTASAPGRPRPPRSAVNRLVYSALAPLATQPTRRCRRRRPRSGTPWQSDAHKPPATGYGHGRARLRRARKRGGASWGPPELISRGELLASRGDRAAATCDARECLPHICDARHGTWRPVQEGAQPYRAHGRDDADDAESKGHQRAWQRCGEQQAQAQACQCGPAELACRHIIT